MHRKSPPKSQSGDDIFILLPDELMLYFMQYLKPHELALLSCVSKRFQRLAASNELWRIGLFNNKKDVMAKFKQANLAETILKIKKDPQGHNRDSQIVSIAVGSSIIKTLINELKSSNGSSGISSCGDTTFNLYKVDDYTFLSIKNTSNLHYAKFLNKAHIILLGIEKQSEVIDEACKLFEHKNNGYFIYVIAEENKNNFRHLPENTITIGQNETVESFYHKVLTCLQEKAQSENQNKFSINQYCTIM